MSKPSIQPSRYLPSYLRLDLNVGSAEENPFVAALDAMVQRMCANAHANSLTLTRDCFPIERKRSVLEGYGFAIASLSDEETANLYRLHESLFYHQGTLRAVSDLAMIYFGVSATDVRRGRPLARTPLRGKIGFPLLVADRDGIDSRIFVSLTAAFSTERKQDFVRSVSVLVPHGFSILLREPSENVEAQRSGRDFSHPSPLREWRL